MIEELGEIPQTMYVALRIGFKRKSPVANGCEKVPGEVNLVISFYHVFPRFKTAVPSRVRVNEQKVQTPYVNAYGRTDTTRSQVKIVIRWFFGYPALIKKWLARPRLAQMVVVYFQI